MQKKTYPNSVSELETLFKQTIEQWRALNREIENNKLYWSRHMIREQHKRARALSREKNHIKMLIELKQGKK